MATLTVQSITSAGIADLEGALAAAASGGDEFQAASGLMVVIKNGDASSKTVTVTKPANSVNVSGYGDLDLSDKPLTVAAGDIGVITFPAKYASSGNFELTYDAVTSVTVGVFSLAP